MSDLMRGPLRLPYFFKFPPAARAALYRGGCGSAGRGSGCSRVAAAALARMCSALAKWINRSESRAPSLTVTSRCARLRGRAERQSDMLTTLLVIVACIAAGMLVNHVHPEYRKW